MNEHIAEQAMDAQMSKPTSNFLERFNISKSYLLEIGIYGIAGCITGFILKKFSIFFICAIIFVSILIGLQHFQFISIGLNWQTIGPSLGLDPAFLHEQNILAVLWEWIKIHPVHAVIYAIGFFLGLKIA